MKRAQHMARESPIAFMEEESRYFLKFRMANSKKCLIMRLEFDFRRQKQAVVTQLYSLGNLFIRPIFG